MKKILLAAASFLLLLAIFLLIKDERILRPNILQKGNSFIEGLTIVYKKNGARNWILTAKRADISDNGEKARLSGIEMTVENKGITLYADQGTYRMADKNLSVEGRILAKGNNYSAISENGQFDHNSGIFRTDGDIKIESARFNVLGKGMTIDSNEQKVTILKNVKAVFHN